MTAARATAFVVAGQEHDGAVTHLEVSDVRRRGKVVHSHGCDAEVLAQFGLTPSVRRQPELGQSPS